MGVDLRCNIKINVRMTKNTNKTKTMENIEFLISIGEFKLRLSLPKHTTVAGLVAIVRGYDALHAEYGPQGMPFMGLGSTHTYPLLDFWLTQNHLDFTRFRRKLQLKSLYASQRRGDKIYAGEFQSLVCLGKGACGAVYLVRSKITGAMMALKRVAKETIKNYQALMTQFQERKNLIRMGVNLHTVNLHACFQSRSHFNFLMDYYPGGELFLHLSQNSQKLKMVHIKLYFCEILLAMEYIHKKKILYRDLKPENIFVDIAGHLRIGDFGMSKCDFEEEDFTTSVCGSPEYMAPEIIDNQNYNFSADFYSLGAILYELLTGVPPYYNESRDNDEIRLQLIKSMAIDFETVTQDPYLQQLLANLLHPDPDYRINNFQEIKNSPWLSGIDWKELQQKAEIMPFAPDPLAPVDKYIGEEFLKLTAEVQQMNMSYEDEPFASQISNTFEYIRPESRKLLGLDNSFQHFAKPKPKGSIKEKKDKCPKKTNLSVALFDREQTICQSVCSEPRVIKGDNKQNMGPLRRDHSKKVVVNLSKQGSTVFLGKTALHENPLTNRHKTQKPLHTPISQNNSECFSKNVSEVSIQSGSKSTIEHKKKAVSRGREMVRGQSRQCKSKNQSKEKVGKESSLNKNRLMKKKEQKKMLPTCSFKIKLS